MYAVSNHVPNIFMAKVGTGCTSSWLMLVVRDLDIIHWVSQHHLLQRSPVDHLHEKEMM